MRVRDSAGTVQSNVNRKLYILNRQAHVFNKLLFGLFVPVIVAAFLYDDLSLGGVGIPVVILLFCLFYGLMHSFNRRSSQVKSFFGNKSARRVFSLYLLFSAVCAIAHVITGSTTEYDRLYLVSLAGQALWFPALWVVMSRSLVSFDFVLKQSIIISVAIVFLFWVFGVVRYVDLFYLRDFGDGFGVFELAPDLMSNPNRAARYLLLLLIFSMFFKRVAIGKSRQLWNILSFIICVIITSTLSRSGIASMIVLVFMNIVGGGSFSKKIVYSWSVIVVIASVVLIFPATMDRVTEAVGILSEIRLTVQTSELDITKSIRARSWVASAGIIRDNFVFGVGSSNGLTEMGRYGALMWKGGGEVVSIWVHGGFLKIATYSGMAGLGLFLWFLYSLAFCFYLRYKVSLRSRMVNSSSAAWIGLSGVIASIPVNFGADWFGVGLLWFVFAYLFARAEVSTG